MVNIQEAYALIGCTLLILTFKKFLEKIARPIKAAFRGKNGQQQMGNALPGKLFCLSPGVPPLIMTTMITRVVQLAKDATAKKRPFGRLH